MKLEFFTELQTSHGAPTLSSMSNEAVQLLTAIESGNLKAAESLFPLAYKELRQIAGSLMRNERAGHTLQPTALVHEAYLRLIGGDGKERSWQSRGHFFTAAAEAMRRILIENARSKSRKKRGQNAHHITFDEQCFHMDTPSDQMIALDEALNQLERNDLVLANIVKLRYFAGMTAPETALALGISESTVHRGWKSARAWLLREIKENSTSI